MYQEKSDTAVWACTTGAGSIRSMGWWAWWRRETVYQGSHCHRREHHFAWFPCKSAVWKAANGYHRIFHSEQQDCVTPPWSIVLMEWLWVGRLESGPMQLWLTPCWIKWFPIYRKAVIRLYIRTELAITDGPDGLNGWTRLARLTPYYAAYFIRDCRYRMSCVILVMKDMASFGQVGVTTQLYIMRLYPSSLLFICPTCIVVLQAISRLNIILLDNNLGCDIIRILDLLEYWW